MESNDPGEEQRKRRREFAQFVYNHVQLVSKIVARVLRRETMDRFGLQQIDEIVGHECSTRFEIVL